MAAAFLLFIEKALKGLASQVEKGVHFVLGSLEVLNAERIDGHFFDVHVEAPAQCLEKWKRKFQHPGSLAIPSRPPAGYLYELLEARDMSFDLFDVLALGVASVTVHDNSNVCRCGADFEDLAEDALAPSALVINEPC